MDYLDFTNKTILIVGGSSGIGNATAQAFREQGATVHVWGTRASAADYVGDEHSDMTGLIYKQMDVLDDNAVKDYKPPFDRLDVLVQSQGLVLYGRAEFEVAGFRKVVDVNLTSLLNIGMKFHDLLSAAKGAMIIVSSSAAFHATKGNPAYNASKAGAVGLTRTLGQAWAPDGIRVNGFAPGFVPTKMTAVTHTNEKRSVQAIDRIPLGRFGTVEEMAAIALFLASPMSGYITGQTLLADGGMLL